MKQDKESMNKFNAIVIPKGLEEAVQKGLADGNRILKKRNRSKNMVRWGSAAAAITLICILLLSNPVLAAKIPIIGHIFEQVQDKYSYTGDFSSLATTLEDEEEQTGAEPDDTAGKDEENTAYSKSADGTTVTLSEIYCNDQALYITLTIESKEVFPDTFVDLNSNPVIALRTTENYSFNSDTIHNLRYLEGKFIDEHTYAGIFRIDLSDVAYDATEYNEEVNKLLANGKSDDTDADINAEIKKVDVPDEFNFDLEINQIIGDRADTSLLQNKLAGLTEDETVDFTSKLVYPNEYENYWFDGPLDYDLDVIVDSSRTTTMTINTTNDEGVGIASVEKTPFELKLNEIYPTEESQADYFPIALDANGDILPYGGGVGGSYVNVFALQNHDISTVDIYICDYDEYMDELKGYYWSDDYEEKKKEKTFKQLLDERAVYHTEVKFDINEE